MAGELSRKDCCRARRLVRRCPTCISWRRLDIGAVGSVGKFVLALVVGLG